MSAVRGEVVWRGLIHLVSWIVPSARRAEWRAEWRAELRHAALRDRNALLRAARGLIPDAVACRRLWVEPVAGGKLEGMGTSLTHAWRTLSRSPRFTLFAIVLLGLGIGSNTAMFSIVERAVLRPLPFAGAERLVEVRERRPHQGRERNPVSYPDFADWRSDNRVFGAMAAYENGAVGMEVESGAEIVDRVRVSAGFFGVLGSSPVLGRDFTESDDRPGAEAVVIVGYDLWQSAFHGRRDLVGETIRLDGRPVTVIGVMGRRDGYPFGVQLWQPLARDVARQSRGSHTLEVIARLSPGVTLAQARIDMVRVADRLAVAYPDVNAGHTNAIYGLQDELVRDRGPTMMVLTAGLALLLLVVCANIASLQLARAVGRRHEMALRSALGATRVRLARQMLVENAFLAVGGAMVGVGLAFAGLRFGSAALRRALPWMPEAALDANVLAFVLVLTIVVVVATGLAPVVRRSRIAPAVTLRDEGRTLVGSASRVRGALVVVEFVLALLLLIGAGLTGRTLLAMESIEPGFDARGVMTADVWFTSVAYAEPGARGGTIRRITAAVEGMPGVEAAGLTFLLPMSGGDAGRNFTIVGRPEPERGDDYNAGYRVATGGYFRAMGIPLLRGRSFEATDVTGAPSVAIINQAMAERFWPDEDAIGQRFLPGPDTITIIGIVGNVLHRDLQTPAAPEFYLSFDQAPMPFATIAVRSSRSTAGLARALRAVVRRVAPEVPVSGTAPMSSRVSTVLSESRALARLVIGFAAVALLLAIIGMYSVMSWSVGQRRREIGLRLAVGGTPSRVRRMVLLDGSRLIAIAIPPGFTGGLLLARAMRGVLFGVEPQDPISFFGAAAVLAAVAWLATLVPAVRATRVDPAHVLRD